MGVLTDLIIATEDELAAVDPDEIPINVLPGLDIKGTGIIELATLHAILGGTEFDPGLEDFPSVSGEESEDGPWIFRFPDSLVHRLASASAAELSRVAAEWARTEELELSGWPPEVLHQRLLEMAEFAKSTVLQGKPVHVWSCL